MTLDVVEAISSFGCAYLKTSRHAPASMQGMVQTLHDSLLRVEFESNVQDGMSRLCEAWYLAEPDSRRSVVPQTMLYLLLRSVGEKGKLGDVKRVCAMREALLCIEIGGQSFQSVQESLMRAAIHPNYVMHDDGRRFLGFVLSLQPHLTRSLHKTIKSQLPRCRKSMLVQYGELYHTAWKRATGPVLHTLEHDCLQDLASHAINTASPPLSSAIRQVLSVFHSKKKFKAVDEMLARIYEPILWRSFKVANASVRLQAAQLLAEAFPVQDPEASAKDFEDGLTRQITVLDGLLKDSVPGVREVGVHCVCRVLSVYLEVLPLHTTTSFLALMIKHLAVDSAAASVRVAVLRGLGVVLDNHLSHPLLAGRLPLLADRIHDSSEPVRVAMAELLLKVRAVKGIRFFDVVALPDILSRLATDVARPAVAKRLTKLLMPSYMPLNKPGAERLARILALVQQDQQAAQVFLKEAAMEAPTEEAVKQLSLMNHALARQLAICHAHASPLKHKSNKASPDVQQGSDVVEGLVLCMAAVAQSLQQRLHHMLLSPQQAQEAQEFRDQLAQALPSQDERLDQLVGPGAIMALNLHARCAVWRLLAMARAIWPVSQDADETNDDEPNDDEPLRMMPNHDEPLLSAWRTGGVLEMQAVMQCMLSAPLEAGAEARGKIAKRLLTPLATGVRQWLRNLDSSAPTAAHKKLTQPCKQRKTGKKKAASQVVLDTVDTVDTAGTADSNGGVEVVERIKALMTCPTLRKLLLSSPSCLSVVVKALSDVVAVVERRLAAPGVSQPHAGLVEAVEVYVSLLLHVHCAQFPAEAGAGKAPDDMCAVLDMATRSAPLESDSQGCSELWQQVGSRLLLVCGDACALNRCNAALGLSIRHLIHKVGAPFIPFFLSCSCPCTSCQAPSRGRAAAHCISPTSLPATRVTSMHRSGCALVFQTSKSTFSRKEALDVELYRLAG